MHSDQIPTSKAAGAGLRRAQEIGLLVNADVGAGKTLLTMEAAVLAFATHAENAPMKPRVNQALELGGTNLDFTTAIIQAASTLAGLALTTQLSPLNTWGIVPE